MFQFLKTRSYFAKLIILGKDGVESVKGYVKKNVKSFFGKMYIRRCLKMEKKLLRK
jgi:hypothetical protein